ncbi:MAG: glutamate--tRNA ligase [Candidatus Edwardsbacteria bacterium]|nr:glutamate--tRNA ligase [Candidatus Edwardsbacteria bacterium]
MPEVRTRFAPSPTGYMHIGNLRTALYAYLIARSAGGVFILRIEDTDQERFVEGSLDVIYNTLRLCGLEYDEGPDIGGPCGPYVQSQRRAIYRKHADKLVAAGGAYYCFCTKERIDALRAEAEKKHEAFRYDGHCKGIARNLAESRIRNGEALVVRQRIPDSGATAFDDIIYGRVEVDNSQLEDGVLLKSDGLPTYNFANVVDDHLMGITHVVRGAEYLSSTPKYNLIYRALGWEIPVLVHLPMIMKDHTRKLGKRYGDPSFEDLLSQGFLKEAVINYIVLLGWNPKDNTEFFTLEELKQRFNISGINNAPAIFDIEKLKWMNGEYIRKLPVERFNEAALPYIRQAVKRTDIDLGKIAALVQPRTVVLSDIPARVDFIDALPEYDKNLFVNKKARTDLANALEYLKLCKEELEKVGSWEHEEIKKALFAVIEAKGLKANTFLTPLRIALSGREVTPGGATELAESLGKTETVQRISRGIGKLSNT